MGKAGAACRGFVWWAVSRVALTVSWSAAVIWELVRRQAACGQVGTGASRRRQFVPRAEVGHCALLSEALGGPGTDDLPPYRARVSDQPHWAAVALAAAEERCRWVQGAGALTVLPDALRRHVAALPPVRAGG